MIRASPLLAAHARIAETVPRDEIPALLGSADALVSANQPTASQTLDKVVYEAAACAVPVIASNPALHEFLDQLPVELRFPPRDAAALADRLLDFAAAPGEARAATGAELRRRVVRDHSVEHWADAVVAAVRETGSRGRPE